MKCIRRPKEFKKVARGIESKAYDDLYNTLRAKGEKYFQASKNDGKEK